MDSPKFGIEMGKRIKQIREEANLTQAQVAKKAGMKANYFAVIERGEVVTSSEKIKNIANALGVDISRITNPK
ncbi:MAG TPA: helix-turn-helix transcriptional regulator [Candidatus Saccharimonadales bacterium]|nr:helix-turn-helix transcriptional regulator [Candidatus Saccharimonadales bacterium]